MKTSGTSCNNDFIRPVNEVAYLDESGAADGPEPEACIVEVYEVDEEHQSGGVGSPFPPAFSSGATNEPQKKRKKSNPDPLLTELQNISSSVACQKKPDAHEYFALSLCDPMRSIYPSKVLRMRKNILQAIEDCQD